MNRYTKQDAPTYHSQSAHSGRTANRSVPRYTSLAEIQQKKRNQVFKAGFLSGLTVGLLIMAAVLWLFVIPITEGTLHMAMGAIA